MFSTEGYSQIVIQYNLNIIILGNIMEIPIVIRYNHYREETVDKWRDVWSTICEMCYNGNRIAKSIIVLPGSIQIDEELSLNPSEQDHCEIYRMRDWSNDNVITLDHTWKKFSKTAGPRNLLVVPEFKELHVPKSLFDSLGVTQWFRHCFPNCKVTYWDI